jgi:hypothetical protein
MAVEELEEVLIARLVIVMGLRRFWDVKKVLIERKKLIEGLRRCGILQTKHAKIEHAEV